MKQNFCIKNTISKLEKIDLKDILKENYKISLIEEERNNLIKQILYASKNKKERVKKIS